MFKPVVGWEGLYEVSEEGVIISTPRNGNGFKSHILAQSTDSYGYKVVHLRNGQKNQMFKVHRLVAQAFIPNPDNKPQVNHKFGNKTDNHYTNLEWTTPAENIRHAKELGLQQECYNRIIVEQVDLQTGVVIATYPSLKEAEIQTKIHWNGISAVLRGKRKSAGGYFWRRFND
jgi:hypothetical protein